MKNKNKNQDIKQEEYVECFGILNKRWNFLDKVKIELSNTFDKYVLTFSTGSLYLSVLFTNNFNQKETIGKILVAHGWTFLLLAIFSTLSSIYLSIIAYGKQMKITDDHIREIDNKKFCEPINYWNYLISFFQVFYIMTFMAGIILLSVFYYINLK